MRNVFFISFILLLNLTFNSFSQKVNIEGKALLKKQTTNDNITVNFHRTEPKISDDTVKTDSNGNFRDSLDIGIYSITFSKPQFKPVTLTNVLLFSDTRLNDVTLEPMGLTGSLSGILAKGDYIVSDNIWVNTGDTLRIEPGTRMFFKKNLEFLIMGILYAVGTETEKITFTRFLDSADNSDDTYWRGINFKNMNSELRDASVLQYCNISLSNKAVFAELASPTLSHLIISDCNDKYGEGVVVLDVSNSKVDDIKFVNIDAGQTNIYTTACFVMINVTTDINNIEITGIKNKNMSAIGLFGCGGINLNNCFIHDNAGPVTVGLQSRNDSTVNFNNSTIVKNQGLIMGDTSYFYNFYNCIFANETEMSFYASHIYSSDIYNFGSTPYFQDKSIGVNVSKNKNGDSCDINGNIILDPKFIDYSEHDYYLLPESPCIDAGKNDLVRVKFDFAGNCRIWDGNLDGDSLVDMGAFEYGAPINQQLIYEDFEKGNANWKIQSVNSDGTRWKVEKLPLQAHSGSYCLLLPASGQSTNSSITTPFVILPDKSGLKLTFWLSSGVSGNVKSGNYKSLSSNNNQLSIKLNILNGTEVITKELMNVQNIHYGWKKFEIDLSDYGGLYVALSFNGIIDSNGGSDNGLLLDDIIVSNEDITSAFNEEYSSNYTTDITVCPNPASDYITIAVGTQLAVSADIRIYDIFGQEEHPPTPSCKEGEVRIDVSALPAGVYFVRVGDMVSKFVKI